MKSLRRPVPTVEILEDRIAPATFHWNVDAAGNWNDQNNWINETAGNIVSGFPNAVDDVAKFLDGITNNRTITIPTAVTITVGQIIIDEAQRYSIGAAGSGALVLDVSTGGA